MREKREKIVISKVYFANNKVNVLLGGLGAGGRCAVSPKIERR
jgi:Tfp pilus tip-associated adhesin PilY1